MAPSGFCCDDRRWQRSHHTFGAKVENFGMIEGMQEIVVILCNLRKNLLDFFQSRAHSKVNTWNQIALSERKPPQTFLRDT
jgi:hypothetical protein